MNIIDCRNVKVTLRGKEIPFFKSAAIESRLEDLVKLISAEFLDSDATAIELAVLDQDLEILIPLDSKITDSVEAFGSVEGDILAMSSRHNLTFALFDSRSGNAIVCHADEAQEQQVQRMYHRRARVEGLVTRDASTGRPTEIREIRSVTPADYSPGDYKMARGLFPAKPGDKAPEELIRRVRDAW